jgi:biotin operon repressor
MKVIIYSDVLEYLQSNCRGYDNRSSGKDLEFALDYSYKEISDAIVTLNLSGEPVFNLDHGYFYLGKENNTARDLQALLELTKHNNEKYQKLNQRKATLDNALKKMNNIETEL